MMPLKRSKAGAAEARTAEASPQTSSPETEGTPDALEQVRELLFGSQMRSQQGGLEALTDRLEQTTSDLRDDVRAEISSLERMVTNKVNSVTGRFHTEVKARGQAVEELEGRLGELGSRLEARLDEMRESLAAAQREQQEHRERLTTHLQELQKAIQERHEEAVGLMARQVDEVKTAATDRSSLASMLVELAGKLSDGSRTTERR